MIATTMSLLLLHGCPDPQTASSIGHGPGGAANPGAPSAGPPVTTGASPEAGRFDVTAGEGVLVSGTFEYSGETSGKYRIDFLQKDGDAPPRLLHTLELDAPGAFELEAPAGTGSVFVVGFVDADGDGPSNADPGGMLTAPIVIDNSPIADLVLTISEAPDLGDFTPGGHHFDPSRTPTEVPAPEVAPAEAPPAEPPLPPPGDTGTAVTE
jgi:hypothetical protein